MVWEVVKYDFMGRSYRSVDLMTQPLVPTNLTPSNLALLVDFHVVKP